MSNRGNTNTKLGIATHLYVMFWVPKKRVTGGRRTVSARPLSTGQDERLSARAMDGVGGGSRPSSLAWEFWFRLL